MHKLKDTGAVASSVAGVIYGLNILAQDIQVHMQNCDHMIWLRYSSLLSSDVIYKALFYRMIVVTLLASSCWQDSL